MRLVLLGDFGTLMEVVEDTEAYDLTSSSGQLMLLNEIAEAVKEMNEYEYDDHLPPDPIDLEE